MSFNTEMIRHLESMLKLLQAQERKHVKPEPEPEPFKPERAKKNETYLEKLQRLNRDEIAAGRAVSMNSIYHSVADPKPPRAPGQQQRRSNALWSWWR